MEKVIIEFAGLPGSGKTTLSNELINELTKRGYNVVSRRDLLRFKYINNVHITVLYILFKPSLWKDVFKIINFSKQFPNNNERRLYVKKLIVLYSKLISFNKEKEKFKKTILILDEGFVQYLTSIPHDFTLDNSKKIIELCNLFNNLNNIKTINCSISIEKAADRILSRKKNNDRFLLTNQDAILKLLSIKRANIGTVLNNVTHDIINFSCSENDNTNIETILNEFEN